MKLFIILSLVCYWLACCAPSVTELAKTSPETVIARKDELLSRKSVSEETLMAVVNAYNTLGSTALNAKNYDEAEKQFKESLVLDNKNKQARYGLTMIEGLRLFKKGNRSSLWDSLEKFGEATYFDPTKGEPYYWMGRAYEKKDDGDFELIAEAYENALKGNLTPELKTEAENCLATVKIRQKTHESFWK